jgi:carbon-monoxide dehydrogenase large subunit
LLSEDGLNSLTGATWSVASWDGQIGKIPPGVGPKHSQVTILVGATGDLSRRKLLPGFMDYAMSRADMLPNFEIALEEVRCETNPVGVKGIGESGTIGAPPIFINAIIDALSPLGIDRIDMPATPSRVWQVIRSAKGAA